MWHDPLVAISYRVASPGARLSTDKTNSRDDYIWTTICLLPSSMFRVGCRYLLSPFGQSAIIRERLFMVFRLLRPEDFYCCKRKWFVFLVYAGEGWVRERGKLFLSKNSLSVLSCLCAERSLNVSKLNTQRPNSFHWKSTPTVMWNICPVGLTGTSISKPF